MGDHQFFHSFNKHTLIAYCVSDNALYAIDIEDNKTGFRNR